MSFAYYLLGLNCKIGFSVHIRTEKGVHNHDTETVSFMVGVLLVMRVVQLLLHYDFLTLFYATLFTTDSGCINTKTYFQGKSLKLSNLLIKSVMNSVSYFWNWRDYSFWPLLNSHTTAASENTEIMSVIVHRYLILKRASGIGPAVNHCYCFPRHVTKVLIIRWKTIILSHRGIRQFYWPLGVVYF